MTTAWSLLRRAHAKSYLHTYEFIEDDDHGQSALQHHEEEKDSEMEHSHI